MSVRAKFKVSGKTPGEEGTVYLQPVVGGEGNKENDRFFKATPGGSITLGTVNPEAFKQFEVGKEYYVDFTAAEAPSTATAG